MPCTAKRSSRARTRRSAGLHRWSHTPLAIAPWYPSASVHADLLPRRGAQRFQHNDASGVYHVRRTVRHPGILRDACTVMLILLTTGVAVLPAVQGAAEAPGQPAYRTTPTRYDHRDAINDQQPARMAAC